MLKPAATGNFAEVFARIDLRRRQTLLVGLSGGSDSTALLVLAQEWLRRHKPSVSILAVTVDHGLRPESAQEAAQMAGFCARLGVAHRICRWTGPKPSAGIAAAAREARYRLLAEAARDAGSDLVLVAHTAEDQAETVWMRLDRAEGGGLAGMALSTLYLGQFWILRPLLQCRRENLRAELRRRRIGWIEDPSNADPRFERVRARAALQDPARMHEMLARAGAHRARRVRLDEEAAQYIRSDARRAAPGLIEIDPVFLAPEPGPLHAFRILLACTGGRSHLPGMAATRALQTRLAQGRSALGGTLVTPRRGRLYLHRELRDLPECDAGGIFDGRYRIEPDMAARGWRLIRRPGAGKDLVGAALSAEPILQAPPGSEDTAPTVMPWLAPFDHFLSGFDLASAGAAADLYGRSPYPASPLPETPDSA